jgi:hypothetical protein
MVVKMMTRRSFDKIFTPISSSSQSSSPTRSNPVRSFTVYTGAQPTAQTIEANWVNYNSSSVNCLAHYSTGTAWSYNSGTLTYYFTNTSEAITTTALNSGVATWAIIWAAATVSITSETEVPAAGKFIVVPVTSNTGIGGIRYVSTTATQGAAFVPYDGGITIVEA